MNNAGVAAPTPRERRILLVLCAFYAALVIPIGIRKGPDLENHLRLADQFLRGLPLYPANPTLGVWWPPFTLVALAPLALVARWSLAAAKAMFALLGVACLGWSITRLRDPAWPRTALMVAAVSVPLQTNFEYLNLNAVLLALVVAAGADLAAGRDTRAGVWLGLATAAKLFPVVLLGYCAYRRRWRACVVGAVTGLGLTALPLLAASNADAPAAARRWVSSSLAGGWTLHPGNQSLGALVGRAGGGHSLAIVVELVVCALVAVALRKPPPVERLREEVGVVTLVAVLLSPIAWSHYFLLAMPAWAAALAPERARASGGRTMALVVAGIATSGVLTLSSYTFKRMLLSQSIFTWGGLLLLGVLLTERARASLAAPRSGTAAGTARTPLPPTAPQE